MENRNTRFKVIGAVIVLALLIGLLLLVNSSPNINPQKSYKIEIYHCPQMSSDEVLLQSEIYELIKSTELPSSSGFIAPIVQLHEKLNGGDLKEISVRMTGLSRLREFLNEDYYDFLVRKSEEEELFEKLFASDNYNEFKSKAMLQGDIAVNGVPYDQGNCVTEFFINANQSFTNSSDNKIWNSLPSLKLYINSLIAANKIKSGSVIKVYYQCGGPNAPVDINSPDGDLDGDGVVNKLDECRAERGEVQCSGCPCPPPPPCPDGDSDRDGICDSEDKCPNEFGKKKYGGCKIPDSDKDWMNDEIDKCPNEYSLCCGGCPDKDGDGVIDRDDDCDEIAGDASNRGCPKISIQFQVGEGQFLVSVPNTLDFTAEFVIIESSGKKIVHALDKFNNMSFGGPEIDTRFKDNYEKLYKSIQDPLGLDIMVVVKNNKGQIVKESPIYRDMTMICFSSGQCGFVKM